MSESAIRELESESAWREAFPLMHQLRPDLDEETYLDYLAEMITDGYRLFGAFDGGELVAIAGVDISVDMAYGRHVWVYDLITDADRRSEGHGERLMSFLRQWAADHGCERIALSSGVQRSDAHRFYEDRIGMEKSSYIYRQPVE